MFTSSAKALSQRDLDLIHGSAVEILRETGVRVDHPDMRALLSDFGCKVDSDVVRFPEPITQDVVDKMRDPTNLIDGYVGTLYFADAGLLQSGVNRFYGQFLADGFSVWGVDSLAVDSTWIRFSTPGFELTV